jgi:hypothetical protein
VATALLTDGNISDRGRIATWDCGFLLLPSVVRAHSSNGQRQPDLRTSICFASSVRAALSSKVHSNETYRVGRGFEKLAPRSSDIVILSPLGEGPLSNWGRNGWCMDRWGAAALTERRSGARSSLGNT